MAAAIAQLASDPDRRTQLGAKAAEAYQAHFTLEQMASAYMQLYSKPR